MRRGGDRPPSAYLAREAVSIFRKKNGARSPIASTVGASVDTAILLAAMVDMLRRKMRVRKHKYRLDDLIDAVCEKAPFPVDRRIMYSEILKRYYGLVSEKNASKRACRKTGAA